jgi:hypothetical protein
MGEVSFFGGGSRLLCSGAGLGYFFGLRVCDTGVGRLVMSDTAGI